MNGLYLILAGVGTVGLLALLYGLSQRKRGRAAAVNKGLKAAVGKARKAGEIDEDVARTSDDDLYRELHGNGRE